MFRVPAFLGLGGAGYKGIKNGEVDDFTVLLFWIIQQVFLLL